MEQNQITYKDIVIEQLSYRISELENYAKSLIEQNNQLRKELSDTTTELETIRQSTQTLEPEEIE